ncbi:hypothetical protein GGR52DRAFT_551825 [Hypoxylon sp. FL1284]|nr:hypothetical protein GGR52DRAFT_551825 [Hypoxylon sp. FL1284]
MDPNNTPGLDPPPGVEPNFVNPYTLQPRRIAVASVCLALGTISVVGRILMRAFMKRMDLDDYVLILSSASFITLTVTLVVAGQYGDGKHQWNVTQAALERVLLLQNISDLVFCVAVFTIKYVVLHQIETIFFSHHQRTLTSRVIRAFIWTNFLLYAALFLAFILACVPREKLWKPYIEGHCINIPWAMVTSGFINLLSDIIIILAPIGKVWRLQMKLENRIRVAAVFAIGILAPVASALRCYYSLRMFHSMDLTWDMSPIGQLVMSELTVGYLVAAAPYFPRLIEYIRGRGKKPVSSSPSDDRTLENGYPYRIQVDRTWAVSALHRERSITSSQDMILSEYHNRQTAVIGGGAAAARTIMSA